MGKGITVAVNTLRGLALGAFVAGLTGQAVGIQSRFTLNEMTKALTFGSCDGNPVSVSLNGVCALLKVRDDFVFSSMRLRMAILIIGIVIGLLAGLAYGLDQVARGKLLFFSHSSSSDSPQASSTHSSAQAATVSYKSVGETDTQARILNGDPEMYVSEGSALLKRQ